MIRVQAKPEYPAFDREVRQKGLRFLRSCPNPDSTDFKRHNYWSKAQRQLYAAYDHMCAYTTRELVYTGSVDHFKPKSKYPRLAYEWSNYRLARQVINKRKGDTEEVIDPFTVGEEWFILDLPSCLIRAGRGVSGETRKAVNATINILGLNRDDRLVDERCRLLVDLADGLITLRFLERHYPFLCREVRRQQVYDSLKVIFART